MVRFGFLSVCLQVTFASIVCVSIRAQTANDSPSTITKVRDIPAPIVPQPFSTTAPKSKSVHSIEFRPADEMSENDRLLVSNDESSIAEHAGINGFNLAQGQWSYEEIVCPALPNHLFLRYTRNNGDRDITVFSASIPRNGEGRVRVIPIQKRSYSLFSPAPINALTISAFNHIRTEESKKDSASWIGNGLCYAALAGAHPTAISPNEIALEDDPPVAQTATLHVQFQGGEMVEFSDVAAKPHPMEWEMTFTRKGKLIKARHSQAPTIEARHVTDRSPVLQTRQVPQ